MDTLYSYKTDSVYDSDLPDEIAVHLSKDGFFVSFDIDDLSDTAKIQLTSNYPNHNLFSKDSRAIIPVNLNKSASEYTANTLLYLDYNDVLSFVSRKFLQARRDRYSPLKSGKLISRDKEFPNDLVLPNTNLSKEGTPLLRWNYGSRGVPSGWELWLSGPLPGKRIGFAGWNDESGINSLIELMSKPEIMVAQSVLTDSAVMAGFMARKEIFDWYQSNQWKIPSLKEIRKVLAANQLTSRFSSPIISAVGSTSISINSVNIPIMITILIPDLIKYTKTKEPIFSGVKSRHAEYDIEEEQEKRNAWARRTEVAFQKSHGFTLVTYPEELTWAGYKDSSHWNEKYICLTPIPKEQWNRAVLLLEGGKWQRMKPNDFYAPIW